jgi:hypothetical protein
MKRSIAGFAVLVLLALAGCSRPHPPTGKWEGGYDKAGTIVVARVEILPNGLVKVTAPDITNAFVDERMKNRLRDRLESDLLRAWEEVTPRQMDFDGRTFRKPGGVAPQMVWDKATNQMTLQLYLGANPALPIVLRPVENFHDSPWGTG